MKEKDSSQIEIVEYKKEYKKAFKSLNQEWIETYFKMEEEDYKALDHPDEYIIQKGGEILFAKCDDEFAGVCALIKLNHEKYDYELAKMAVSPKFQGKGIGRLIGEAVINKARELGAKVIYLESNTKLTPAINLYYKLGFKKIQGPASPYKRSNIQMELIL